MSRPALSAALVAVAALALVGCSAEAPPTTAPTTAEPSAAPEEETVASGPDCLVGNWYITQEEMQSFYDTVTASTGAGFTVDGGTRLDFTETTFEYTPEFTLGLDLGGQIGSGTIVGSISGDYSADDTTITTTNEASDAVLTVEIGGVVVDGTDEFNNILATSPINTAPYECTPDGPLIQFDTGSGERTPVQLTRP